MGAMRRLIAVIALAALAAPAAAAAADERIAETSLFQVVSAHGGRLAWSEQDADGGARLMTWFKGVASQVPVERQEGGFDVNLGRGPDGRTVAVYSRCEGAECSLYMFDFARGRERRMHILSRPGIREQGPVIHGERVVFFRGSARKRGLYVGSTRNGAIRRIPKLPSEIGAYDFQGRRLAYTHGRFDGDRFTDTLYLHDVVNGRRRVLARVSSGLLSSARFAGTSFAGRHLYVARVRRFAEGNRFMRIDVRTRRSREVLGRKNVLEAAFTRGRAFYLKAGSEGEAECSPACPLLLTPRLGF